MRYAMPLDPAGNMSLVPSYFAQPGTTIRTEQHNPPLEDIANVMSMHLVRDGRNGMVGPLNMGTFPVKNVGAGVDPSDAATVGQIVGSSPLGIVVDFAGDTAPSGWMLCYGQAISRTTYASLYAVIGTKYGVGDGSTTFNIPDIRGRVTAGKDDMGGSNANRLAAFFGTVARTLGGALGAASHTLTIAQIPEHDHPTSGDPTNSLSGDGEVVTSTFGNTLGRRTGNAGGGQAHPNAQPTFIMNKIIRVAL